MTNQMDEIQTTVRKLGLKIDAPRSLLTVFCFSPQNGKPHIEFNGAVYRYVIEERGLVIDEQHTTSKEKLLYWIFRAITSSMSQDYEIKNRKVGQDYRRIMFDRQLELLTKLSPQWGEWRRQEIDDILSQNPFVDTHPSS